MTLFRCISPEKATGKVKAVYEDIMATKEIDFVPNFWQALSNNPDHLEATWQKLKTVMKRVLVSVAILPFDELG